MLEVAFLKCQSLIDTDKGKDLGLASTVIEKLLKAFEVVMIRKKED